MNPQQNKSSIAGKVVLSLGLIIVSVIYGAWQNNRNQEALITPAQQSYKAASDALIQTISQINTSASPTPPPTPTNTTTTSVPPTQPTGLYADGSYTGNPADAYYGTVQVKAIIRSGKIADVQFLQYPNDRNTSRYINGQAMPLLTQEAIQAQSASVDGVSGATATSGAFIQSLGSALALAKN